MKCARLSLSQCGSGHMRKSTTTLPLSDLRVIPSTCICALVLGNSWMSKWPCKPEKPREILPLCCQNQSCC